jgi:putative transcriptional regulator
MSKAARSNRSGRGSGAKRKEAEALSPRVREMVDDLHAICDAVETGIPLEGVATVRTFRVPAEIPAPSPDEIRAIRGSLGLSQAGFAEFLGAGLGTVRSWELGQREPSALARRFLGAIRDDPVYWRGRLARMSGPPEPAPPGRRGG